MSLRTWPWSARLSLAASLVILLGYASNLVSRHVIVQRMAVRFMGHGVIEGQEFSKRFQAATITGIAIPFYVRADVLLSLDGYSYADYQSGIYLFALQLHATRQGSSLTKH